MKNQKILCFFILIISIFTMMSCQNNKNNADVEIFSVSFVSNCDIIVTSQNIEKGKYATKPQILGNDYDLIGWFTDTTYTEIFEFENIPIIKNWTLYAKWALDDEKIDSEVNYLSSTLYGDNAFIAKMREANKRTVLTTNTIFVSTDGNDNTATGNIENPYKNINTAIEKAANNISNGLEGIVCVRGGVYPQNVNFNNFSGNETNYLTLTTYPGEEVKIVGTQKDENVDFTKSNYIIMEGFIICDNIKQVAPIAVRMDQANNHIIFKNNTITNVKVVLPSSQKEPCGFLIYMNGTSTTASHNNILFYKNNLYDCQTGWSEAIEVVGNCEYINIIENTVTNCGNIGIDIGGNFGYCKDKALDQARYVIVRGNDVSKCISYYATSYAIYVDGARDVLIENNKAYDSLGGIEIGSEMKVVGYEVKNIIVRNNLVYNNIENGITVGGYETKVGIVMNTKIYNNTIVNNAIGYSNTDNDYDCNGQLTISMVDGLEVFNNIFYTSRKSHALIGGDIKESYCKNITFRDNIYYGNLPEKDSYYEIYSKAFNGFVAWCTKTGENGIYADPMFKDIANNDFQLLSTSPAINRGNNTIDSGKYDFLLEIRKIGNIDCGCYEYQG